LSVPEALLSVGILFGRGRAPAAEDGFDLEAHIAESLGFAVDTVDLDALLDGDPDAALSHLDRGHGRVWVYRGWLLSEEDYETLYDAVAARGDRLAVTPAELAAAAYLPEWAGRLSAFTPRSVWTWDDDPVEAWELALDELGPPPWVIKDHLKSGRPHWHLACFVGEEADLDGFREVCDALQLVRADQFQRGFVVREYVELATLEGRLEGRPIPDEHRLVFWQGELVAHAPYNDVEAAPPPAWQFAWLGQAIPSPFFTADVARKADGTWTIIELNDGGCSNLPAQLDPWTLYLAIADCPP
jgi:hypothetical protein